MREIVALQVFWRLFPFYRALRNPRYTGNRRTSGFSAAFFFVGVLWILWILWNPKNSRARETEPLEIHIIREIAVLRVFWQRFPL